MSIGLFGPGEAPVPVPAAPEAPLEASPFPDGVHAGVVYMVAFGSALGVLFRTVGPAQTEAAAAAVIDLAYELVDKEEADFDPIEKLAPQMGVEDADTAYALADTLFHATIGLADIECPKEGLVATAVEQIRVMMGG